MSVSKVFLDTSALLKLYQREAETDQLRRFLTASQARLCLSELSEIELKTALFRQNRTGYVSLEAAQVAYRTFEKRKPEYEFVKLNRDSVEQAKSLLDRHLSAGLRTLDALQLAAALSVGGLETFISFDKRLNTVAEAETLTVPGFV